MPQPGSTIEWSLAPGGSRHRQALITLELHAAATTHNRQTTLVSGPRRVSAAVLGLTGRRHMAAPRYEGDAVPGVEPPEPPHAGAIPQQPSHRSARWHRMAQWAGLVTQLLLCVLVIRLFELESRTFYHVCLLAVGGFVVHALLPLRYRLGFFAALSLVAIAIVLGVRDTGLLVAVSAVLIGICHLRISLGARIGLLVAAGGFLAASRAGWVPAPWSASAWPILGSMFMFRLALYLHGLRYEETRPSVPRTLAYFWMLPNACFPLFPVIDYARFTRLYYDTEPYVIYQTGVQWIARGLTHLLLYRLVYFHLTLSPAGPESLGDLLQYLLATFLLYLRVSGQFHLIVGLLHLYGFHLPETHRLYYLASSFTDFWRRINIYWKDFMMKLVYYPSFFRLRRHGNTLALGAATAIVFMTTWLLHSYQWFWLRGGFPITTQDVLFWGVLGALVVVSTLREAQRPRSPRSAPRGWSASRALRTVGTFSAICILWSLWSSESTSEWLGIWEAAGRTTLADMLLLTGALLVGLAIAGWAWKPPTLAPGQPVAFFRNPALVTSVTLVGLLVLAQPTVSANLPPGPKDLIQSLKLTTLNTQDAALLHKGYYEKLDNVSRLSTQLWDVYGNRPPEWREGLVATEAWRKRNDFLLGDLQPSTSVEFHGAGLSVNRWGMRDRDYQQAKPPGVYRIALLGPSLTMGSGVDDSATFDAFLEERLNQEAGGAGRRYEVLNFGIPAFTLLQQLALLEDRVFAFQPNLVVITGHSKLAGGLTTHLMQVVSEQVAIPYQPLKAIIAEAGVDEGWRGIPIPFESFRSALGNLGVETRLPWREAERRLHSKEPEILRWALARLVADARANNSVPVFLALNVVNDARESNPILLEAAEEAGFVVLDLIDVYDKHDVSSLRVADWDRHPNARGTQLIADRLYEELERRESIFNLGLAAPRAPPTNPLSGETR
jgi:hypothetical protein